MFVFVHGIKPGGAALMLGPPLMPAVVGVPHENGHDDQLVHHDGHPAVDFHASSSSSVTAVERSAP